MTQHLDVERLAIQAGFDDNDIPGLWVADDEQLRKFAALVLEEAAKKVSAMNGWSQQLALQQSQASYFGMSESEFVLRQMGKQFTDFDRAAQAIRALAEGVRKWA